VISPALALGAGLFGLLVAAGALARRARGASPLAAAGAHLVSLLGWGILPVLWLACLGATLGSHLARLPARGGGCLAGLDHLEWQLLDLVPATLVLGVLVWRSVAAAGATRRIELRRGVRASSVRRPTRAGAVWIVPVSRPVAFAAGILRPRAVVSAGLLASLDAAQRQAVLTHEAAHVRLGHPRLLLLGGAVAAAYGRFGPVRSAWQGLRQAFEAAADDEAAAAAGTGVLVSAIRRLARSAGAGTGRDGGAEEVHYRVARLRTARPVALAPSLLVGAFAVLVGLALALDACLLTGVPATSLRVGACFAVLAAVGLRPAWRGAAVGRRTSRQRCLPRCNEPSPPPAPADASASD